MLTRKEELLAAFDDSWRFRWESLDKKLEDITDEEARYLHPMYEGIPIEAEHPPEGTIIWHLVHMANVYQWYRRVMQARPSEPVVTDLPLAGSLEEARENLRRSRQEFRDYVASLTEEQLDEPHFDGRTPIIITRMMPRHDAWHTSHITMLRRLYKYQNV